MFVPGKPFQPSLILRVRSEPIRVKHLKCATTISVTKNILTAFSIAALSITKFAIKCRFAECSYIFTKVQRASLFLPRFFYAK
jgi:hypothetical protein